MRRNTLLLLAAAALLSAAVPASAKLPFVKKSQELGFKDIKNCASCHQEAMPKPKDKGEPFLEMGQWLKEQKAVRKAAEVDLYWLKDFSPKKK